MQMSGWKVVQEEERASAKVLWQRPVGKSGGARSRMAGVEGARAACQETGKRGKQGAHAKACGSRGKHQPLL